MKLSISSDTVQFTVSNFPTRTVGEISWANFQNFAFILKDAPYEEMYQQLIQNKDYNFLLFDGAIVQLKYSFYRDKLTKHVLAYFPTPDAKKYMDSPEDYEQDEYGLRLFTENTDAFSVAFPMRFDYTNEDFTEYDHPYSHATLGNYPSCRIPVTSPVTPLRFLAFILRSFYFERFKEYFPDNKFFTCPIKIDKTLTDGESTLMHFNFI